MHIQAAAWNLETCKKTNRYEFDKVVILVRLSNGDVVLQVQSAHSCKTSRLCSISVVDIGLLVTRVVSSESK